ncbi:MAG: peptide ABC transporter permease [Alphaproteobacteria bacterium]|nr:MAG: peptide ABC transporter permease [Alphaproteobacteria bacterium]
METVGFLGIVGGILFRLWPVWACLAALVVLTLAFRPRLGLYGQLFGSGAGIAGVLICGFWVFTAIFADTIAPLDPRVQMSAMKNAFPGSIEPASRIVFLLGGDHLARDVFSRVVHGARVVLTIAPAATLIALMVGITLGLPAGYFGGRIDNVLSFLANLVLAFPVILLFYLLVTPGIMDTPIPYSMAGLFFLFPIAFFCVLFYTRFKSRPERLWPYLALTVVLGAWIYVGLVFDADPLGIISIAPNELNIFVAVVFASSPGVFRIVRGLVMDIKTRDYVAAAQTRGETPWYIMLWEMLPNARGPLIVDACLRVGYTTILLGTLGFFGLGMGPESPDWGTAIKDGSRVAQLRLYLWTGVTPAVALMSLVLGLNLLADALREESLKD